MADRMVKLILLGTLMKSTANVLVKLTVADLADFYDAVRDAGLATLKEASSYVYYYVRGARPANFAAAIATATQITDDSVGTIAAGDIIIGRLEDRAQRPRGAAAAVPIAAPAPAGEGAFGTRKHLWVFDSNVKLYSPSDQSNGARIDNDTIVFSATPVLLKRAADVQAASATLDMHIRESCAGSIQALAKEEHFYKTASEVRPGFTEAQGEPGGDMTASALFGTSAATTSVWQLPIACKPELHVRSQGGGGILRPGWNGAVKSAKSSTTIDQAVIYTIMDMVRVFFPAGCGRRFFSRPPLGFAVAGYPHIGYLLALEWVGQVVVSLASDAFFLGSDRHKDAVAALPDPAYEAPIELPTEGVDWTSPHRNHKLAEKVSWAVHNGRFLKVLRYDAYPTARVISMARVYSRLYELHKASATAPAEHRPPASVVADARLHYGAHELLVDMAAKRGNECTSAQLTTDGHVVEAVAGATVWLARHGVIYTDFREPNVLVDEDDVFLVDYDDCLLVDEPVRTFDEFVGALKQHLDASDDRTGPTAAGAVRQLLAGGGGYLSALKSALASAFE